MATQTFTQPEPTTGDAEAHRLVARFLYGAAAAVVLSVMLPWVSVEGLGEAHLSAGGALLVLAFAAGYGYAGRLAERAVASSVIVAWAINVLLGGLIAVVYASLSDAEGAPGPAIGVFAAVIGVGLGVAGAIKAKRVQG